MKKISRPVLLSFSASMILFQACSGSLYKAPAPPSADSYSNPKEIYESSLKADNNSVAGIKNTPSDNELSLAECIDIALKNNPSGLAAKEAVYVADEAAGKAMAPYYPEVYASAGYSRFQRHAFMPSGLPADAASSVIGPENDWTGSINAKMTLWDFGERRSRLDSALSAKEALVNDSERTRNEIITGVERYFYGLMAANQAKEVALKNLKRAENHLGMAEARFEAGSVPQNDVLRARVGVADARLSLVRTESMISVASGDLNHMMGIPAETSHKLKSANKEIKAPQDEDLKKAFTISKGKRPEIKAAMHRISAFKSGVDEAEAGFWPKLKAQAGYGLEDDSWTPSDKTWNAGLSIEMPIFTGFAKTHELAGKKAELRKNEAEAMGTIQRVRTEVWKSFAKLKETFEAYKASETMVKEAEESHRSTKERYEAGAATMTDLLDARVSLAKAEADLVTSEWDYFIAEAEFRKASGDIE